ncbi:tetratricopeptide repeat-containing sulfotransferase family protein [Hyphococcus sp.]|uniref:tetratricopeptide repeat-containing sulfotransferase family protein n=1 Tax=Hyphococcus sp. TaxID=2038636 RepID=UPI0035C66832
MSATEEKTEATLREAQRLMTAGRFDDACALLAPLLDGTADAVDALYMSAVCERYLKHPEKAAAHLQKLKTVSPDFGRAFQEEGHLARSLGDTKTALSAYERAVRSNPGLEASWRAQEDLLREAGRSAEAAQAKRQADRLAALPRELLAVTNFIHEGKYLKAEHLCRRFLQQHPRHVEGMRLLADVGARLGVLDDADFLLESAIEFEPDNIQLRLDYIQLLRKRQKFQAALDQAKALYDREPENPLFQSHYAIESLQTGDFEKALTLFDNVLETVPNDPATLTSRGHALKTWGRQEEAIQSYRMALTAKPDLGDAYYALANLKTYKFSDDEVEAMRVQEARVDAAYQDRFHLCFALGKAFEDRGDFEKAFSYYARGNDLKRLKSAYRAEDMQKEFHAQMEICTSDLFKARAGVGCAAPDPIFIVGLPRAGSTLLEQILASHSQVDGTLELPNILSLAQSLRGRRRAGNESDYPKILQTLPAEKFAEMGEAYIEDTRIHRAGAPFFIDKMPNNFRHIGLIHLILPNAKIIDARREPMACCFSGFKQLFAEGQEFTYGLEDIGRYYRDYVELMHHWDAALPGKVLRVQHEDVLDDLEGQLRRMLDFCGLPFEQACLDFYKTERSVRTASSEQVRQPINKTGVDQWRRFEPFLDPLKEALGPALTEYRA